MKIVAISDQHGHFPDIPPCDLLLVGGDNCHDVFSRVPAYFDGGARQKAWHNYQWLAWRKSQPAKYCLATFGNHDFCGQKFGAGVTSLDSDTKLVFDDMVLFHDLCIWMTPWSNTFGDWALMGSEEELAQKYAMIPAGTDILVSHQPPYGYLDALPGTHADDCPLRWHLGGGADKCTCGCEAHVGSKALLDAIQRVKPRVVVCGHIHSGYGQAVIRHSRGNTIVYNVAVVNEGYQLVNQPTVIDVTGCEHDWQEQPGEPPVDVCSQCGERRE